MFEDVEKELARMDAEFKPEKGSECFLSNVKNNIYICGAYGEPCRCIKSELCELGHATYLINNGRKDEVLNHDQ